MNKSIIRALDLIYSSLILIVTLPIIILSMVLVYLEDFKNPIYKQKRIGKNMLEFELYKIRSMKFHEKTTFNNSFSTDPNDHRISKIGKILRKLSIDELPQLLNILKGDMSLIGPRPVLKEQINQYSKSGWKKRHEVKPGLSGISQIRSKKTKITMKEIETLDLIQVNSMSISDYHKIIIRTMSVIIKNG